MSSATASGWARRVLAVSLLTVQLAACTLAPPRGAAAPPPVDVVASAAPATVVPPPAMLVAPAELEARLLQRHREFQSRSQTLSADAVGYYLDVQQAQLRRAEFAELGISRQGLSLQVTMPGSASFAVASAELSAPAREQLDRLAALLVEYQQSLITVHGHTDASGPAEVNQRLSQQRALAVARYLVAAGVAESRVFAVGHGASQPLQAETDALAAERNRRVELRIDPLLPATD